MPLDNAQFISELSITDPPGTDPLNQGDDQIRTVKRATQQSFPNIDAPVTLTAAQLEQAAIKNEANTFTQVNTFQTTLIVQGHIRGAFGVAATPGHSFENQINSGMYASTNLLGFATEGVERLRLTASQARFGTTQLFAQSGAVGTPSYSFLNNPDMGMYRDGSNVLGFATAGVQRMNLTGTAMQVKQPVHTVNGSAAAPAYSFQSEVNAGMFNIGSALGFAVGGATRMSVNSVSELDILQNGAAGGVIINFKNSAGVTAWAIQYEGTGGFQPQQFSFSRFNPTTGAFIDIPLYIATDGRVHTALPVLSP